MVTVVSLLGSHDNITLIMSTPKRAWPFYGGITYIIWLNRFHFSGTSCPVVLELNPGYFIYAGLSEPDLPAPEDYSRAGHSGYPANLTKACLTYIVLVRTAQGLLGQSSKVQKYPSPGQIAKEFILAAISLYICVL